MRDHHRCPKCSHPEVLHVPEPRDASADAMAIGGVQNASFFSFGEVHGGFEAYMCMGCGFTELYVRKPKAVDISRLENARVLTADASETPYR